MNPFRPSFWMRFLFAWRGIWQASRSESSLQIHWLAAVVMITAGFLWGLTRLEWGLLVLTISCVIAAELFNTAIEKTLDRLAPDWHPLTGQIKDMAAGAVLIITCAAIVIGLLLFLPRLALLL